MVKLSSTIFTLAVVFLVAVTTVSAVSDENVTTRRSDRQAEIQEIRQDRQENREEMRSNVAANHANRLERRFNFYFTRLTNIITRFQKRLDILGGEGKDISSVQIKLDLAKTKLDAAVAKGIAAVSAFRAIDPAKFSEQKTAAFAARDLANAARILFEESRQALKTALKELKTISKPALPAASAAIN